jgi:ATP/maltotriose-dependent transcriptional regulator MalT
LLLVSGILFLLWTRQKNKLKEERLLKEKQLAEAASKSANERLQTFTQHIIEKNELIEQLQQQLQIQNHQVNEELLKQTILTDDDWRRFREMFTQVHPAFFKNIQQIAPDITAAELRMAAVIKLGLGNKYIASMLGVSGDTVRKSKFRLRQRLQLDEDKGLEDFIMQL